MNADERAEYVAQRIVDYPTEVAADDHHCGRCAGKGYCEVGPSGATYSGPCDMCGGSGKRERAPSDTTEG